MGGANQSIQLGCSTILDFDLSVSDSRAAPLCRPFPHMLSRVRKISHFERAFNFVATLGSESFMFDIGKDIHSLTDFKRRTSGSFSNFTRRSVQSYSQ